jgi:hypothetical protein
MLTRQPLNAKKEAVKELTVKRFKGFFLEKA